MIFEPNNKYGKGRPKGSKNKVNKDLVYKLLDRIAEDFNTNYDELTATQKIKIVSAFKDVYKEPLEIEVSDNGIGFKDLITAIQTKNVDENL